MAVKAVPTVDLSTQLRSEGYGFFKGVEVDPKQKDAFKEFAATFDKLKEIKNSFFSSKLDSGIFDYINGQLAANVNKASCIFKNTDLYNNIFLKHIVLLTLSLLPIDQKQKRIVEVILNRQDRSTDYDSWMQDSGCWVAKYNISQSSSGIEQERIKISKRFKKDISEGRLEKPLDAFIYSQCLEIQIKDDLTVRTSAAKVEGNAIIDSLIIKVGQSKEEDLADHERLWRVSEDDRKGPFLHHGDEISGSDPYV